MLNLLVVCNKLVSCTHKNLRQYFPVTYTETEGETEGAVDPPCRQPTPGTRGGGVGLIRIQRIYNF